VRWANHKYVKPIPPSVILKLGSVTMSSHPSVQVIDGATVKSYPSWSILEVNLYSPGVPEEENPGAGVVQYQNSACDELAGFCIFLDYPSTEALLFEQEFSLLPEGPVRDITAILDGIEPEFRAMAEFRVDFVMTITDPYAFDGTEPDGSENGIDATGWFEDVEITNRSDDSTWETP